MKIQLSDHFTYKKLMRFAVPSIVMLFFTSIYEAVDGFFISNFVGETEFAGVNLVMPYLMIFSSVGLMIGTGGNALISLVMGQGDARRANRIFSMLNYVLVLLGVLLAVIGIVFLRPVCIFFGAEGKLLETCLIYGRIYLFGLPVSMLEWGYQSFFVADEKAQLGLVFMLLAGITNMVLDYLFIAVFRWNVTGAVVATVIGQCVGGIGPLIYFLKAKDSKLRLCPAAFVWKDLVKVCSNGAVEFITNASMSLVGIVYNFQLMKYIGEYGISAYGIIMYINFIFVAVFLGYAMSVSPVISYNYGAQNYKELKNLFRKSLVIVVAASVILTAAAILTAEPFARIFAGYDEEFLKISTRALMLYSASYIFTGFNIFGGMMFSALNNGVISTVLSAARVLVFQLLCVFAVPLFLGIDGIWLAIFFAEMLAAVMVFLTLRKNRERYHYV